MILIIRLPLPSRIRMDANLTRRYLKPEGITRLQPTENSGISLSSIPLLVIMRGYYDYLSSLFPAIGGLLLKKPSRRESEPESVVSLKLTNTDASTAEDEFEIEAHIANTDPSYRGYPLFRTSLERFDVRGPQGSHCASRMRQ